MATNNDIEQCSYCKEWFPKPVALHHSNEECDLNVAEHSAAAQELELKES